MEGRRESRHGAAARGQHVDGPTHRYNRNSFFSSEDVIVINPTYQAALDAYADLFGDEDESSIELRGNTSLEDLNRVFAKYEDGALIGSGCPAFFQSLIAPDDSTIPTPPFLLVSFGLPFLDGEHVCVATGTGSGKSWCFGAPIFASLDEDDAPTSLLLFPTKALAHDQYTKMNHGKIAILDGDTPHAQRREILEGSQVLLTNPDTLHANLGSFQSFLSRLRYVTLDEAHLYQGVFGSHISTV